MKSLQVNIEPIKEPVVIDYFKQFNSVLRRTFNILKNNPNIQRAEFRELINSMNNTNLMDVASKEYAETKAKGFLEADQVPIFGSKQLFTSLKYGKSDKKDEYLDKRNGSIFFVGRCSDSYGCRKIKLELEENQFILKINKKNNFTIKFKDLSERDRIILFQLQEFGNTHKMPLSYTLTKNYLVIHYDHTQIEKSDPYKAIPNRVLSFDMNPNNIGLVIMDGEELVHKEVYNLYKLTRKNSNNDKLLYETYEISKLIVKLCRHYKVDCVAFENLSIKSKDNKKGKNYNRLVNNYWPRAKFISNLKNKLDLHKISYKEISTPYSSFVGQILNTKEYDFIAAAIEISRRYFEIKKQNYKYWFPKISCDQLPTRWKEMAGESPIDWIQFYRSVKKKFGESYRFLYPWAEPRGCLSLFSKKSGVELILV